jgi:sulfur-oxidizing protein SoxZ
MAEIGKVRIRIPPTIKQGDVVRVRSLVIHPMEIVRRDKDGKPMDANYRFIHKVSILYNGREVLQADTTQSVSENPFFTFAFRATEPGTLRIVFLDTHGGRYEGSAEITFS